MRYDFSDEFDRTKQELEEEREREQKRADQNLLDHFAGLAMVGLIQSKGFSGQGLASEAYGIAYAMLKERKEQKL